MVVTSAEAVAILRRMIEAPDEVRAVRLFDVFPAGPAPFVVPWRGGSAEVTVHFAMDEIEEIASVRVGDRFANYMDWMAEGDTVVLDQLSDIETDLFEQTLRRAGARR